MKLAARTKMHRKTATALRERKQLRLERAAVHAAMTKAARMVRSRKKGTRNFDDNMFDLGFVAKDGYEHEPYDVSSGSDVLDKYRSRDMAHEFRFTGNGIAS